MGSVITSLMPAYYTTTWHVALMRLREAVGTAMVMLYTVSGKTVYNLTLARLILNTLKTTITGRICTWYG